MRTNRIKLFQRLPVLGLALLLWPLLACAATSEERLYTFGIVPQFDGREIQSRWQPILAVLARQSGYRFELAPAQGMSVFHGNVSLGVYDFVYFDPYRALTANQEQGYIPLVRNKHNLLQGIIVVRKNGPIAALADLQGRDMVFPSPRAFGATLLIRSRLAQEQIAVRPRYVDNHRSVYLNVALGQAVAGGGVESTLAQEPPALRDQLQILFRTKAFAPHPVSAHPSVPPQVRAAVQQALLKMGTSAEGRVLLAKIPMAEIGPATLEDYKPLQRLGLEKFHSVD